MSDLVRLETRHGPMLAFRQDAYITRSLELYGEFSGREWKLFEQVVQPGMTVVEVGANIGAHTVPLARKCAPGPLYAFEPQQRVFQALCANLALNDITNVIASPDACGAEPGWATIPPLDYGSAYNFGGVSLGPEGHPGARTRVIALDDLDLPACHFLKIDVEGFEPEVLKGARETITSCRPYLYVENDRQENQQQVIDLIDGLGYRMYWHVPPMFDPANFAANSQNVFGEIVSANVLGVPGEGSGGPSSADPIDPSNWRSPVRFG